MAITDGSGSVKMYKNGQLISKEEYEKYKEDFEVIRDKSARAPRVYAYRYGDGNEFSFSMPPIPPIPPIPGIVLPRSSTPYYYKWEGNDKKGNKRKYKLYAAPKDGEDRIIEFYIDEGKIRKEDYKKYEDIIREGKKRNKNRVRIYDLDGQNLQELEKLRELKDIDKMTEEERCAYEKAWEKWGEEYGKAWEKQGEAWGRWGENFGKGWERWGEEFGEKFGKAFDKEYNRKFTELREELIKDGLLDKNTKSLKINVSGKRKEIKINGKQIPENLYPKYEKLLKEKMGLEVIDNDTNWNWNSNWDEDDRDDDDDDDDDDRDDDDDDN